MKSPPWRCFAPAAPHHLPARRDFSLTRDSKMQRLMKTTKILFIAAAAVAMTLASCTKEQTGTTENGQTSGLRTLTVSFATSPTRTTLYGLQPKWKADDKIYLADGTGYEVYTVTTQEEGEEVIRITTALTIREQDSSHQGCDPDRRNKTHPDLSESNIVLNRSSRQFRRSSNCRRRCNFNHSR